MKRIALISALILITTFLVSCNESTDMATSSEAESEIVSEVVKDKGYLPKQLSISNMSSTNYVVDFKWSKDSCIITSNIEDLEQIKVTYNDATRVLKFQNIAEKADESDPYAPTSSRRFDTIEYTFDDEGYLTGITKDGKFNSEIKYQDGHKKFQWRMVTGQDGDEPIIDTVEGTEDNGNVIFKIPTDDVIAELVVELGDKFIDSITMQFPEKEATRGEFKCELDENGNIVSIEDGMGRTTVGFSPSETVITADWQKYLAQNFMYITSPVGIGVSTIIAMCYLN